VAKHYADVDSTEELVEALRWGQEQSLPILALGGGSNMIFLEDFEGLVIHQQMQSIDVIEETDQYVNLRVGSGMNWHELVVWSVEQGYHGIENLALIPGTVGAAPIQNIGAYGVELEQVFEQLTAVHRPTGEVRTFDRKACRFGYRDSFFKQPDQKGQWLITTVTLRLQKGGQPDTSYRSLQNWLKERGFVDPSPHQVMEAVIAIRQSKLPDPQKIGNAGSFFKNPIVKAVIAQRIRQEYPEMPSYEVGENEIKIPAGWLIEQAGWKGKSEGAVGCFEKQALVLVNRGGATGDQVARFARQIRDSVEEQFGIRLEHEVNLVNMHGYTTL
jgi:UDP-N-acetylmuramate dehydrogenase